MAHSRLSSTIYNPSLGVAFAATLIMSLLAPQGLTWLPIALAAVTLATTREVAFETWVKQDGVTIGVISLFFLVAFFSATFVPNTRYVLFVLSVSLSILIAGYINLTHVRAVHMPPLRRIPEIILAGWMVLTACLILLLNDIFNLAFIRGSRALDLSTYNRPSCAVAMLTPLVVVSVSRLIDGILARTLTSGILIIFAASAVFASESESAMLTLPIVLGTQALIYAVPRLGRWVVWTVIAVIFVTPLIVPEIVRFIMQTPLWTYKPGTFAARLALWDEVARLIPQSFIFGHGIEVVRWRPLVDPGMGLGTAFMHPHSFMLQLWVELGLVGVTLFSIGVLLATRSWRSYSQTGSALLHAMLIGALTVSAMSDGLWQTWWTGFLTLYFLFGFALLANAKDRPLSASSASNATAHRHNWLLSKEQVSLPVNIFFGEASKERRLRAGIIFLTLVFSQVALWGAFFLRLGASEAYAQFRLGLLPGLMVAATSFAFFIRHPASLLVHKDDERMIVSWASFVAIVVGVWLLLVFLIGGIDKTPRSIPFLFTWIFVSLGLAANLFFRRVCLRATKVSLSRATTPSFERSTSGSDRNV